MCDNAEHKTEYSSYDDGYDARYCVDCNEWLEQKCSDPDCMYCGVRPDRPLPVVVNLKAIECCRSSAAALEAAKNGNYDPEKEY
jgi:hypothetical protein